MNLKEMAGNKAAEYIKDGMIVGLGTGSTAYYIIQAVGRMVAEGKTIKAVATSKASAELAESLNIPIYDINDVDHIDVAVDGVDEIDPAFNAIKGGGGALYREKIVAQFADCVIWIMDDSKLVEQLGAFHLPVEIVPYGYQKTLLLLEQQHLNPVLRKKDGATFITDNGNYIADLHLGVGFKISEVAQTLKSIVGICEDGLFLQYCDLMIVGTEAGAKVIQKS